MIVRFAMTVAGVFMASTIAAYAKNEFGQFKKEPSNVPGNYRVIPDPTGKASSLMVHRFNIKPGKCSNFDHGNGKSDCKYKSVRSQLYEPNQKQPEEAWYAWNMYLPTDFPVYTEQTATGLYSFGYWHNGDCPHVSIGSDTGFSSKLRLQTMKMATNGSYDCVPDKMITIGDLKELRGKWHRFEVHAKWSASDDGIVEVFLDGAQAAALRGRTLTKGPTMKNYFKFGIYLCCTKGVELVKPATVFYSGISRADTRENLK